MKLFRLLLTLAGLLAFARQATAQIPTVTSIGPEEYISSSYMEHPSVAADSLGQPHMVADFGVGSSFMKFHRVKGRWTGGVFATGARGGRYDASRLYIGQIEIDARDRAWVSCKMGIKEFGDMYGQGVWLFGDVDTNPYPKEQFFRFVCVYKGMGVISTDAKYPDQGVVLGTFGNWEKLNTAGQTLGRGSINAGHGGEKVRFRIASYAPRYNAPAGRNYADGVWHTAMNGFSTLSSKYQNSLRYKAGAGPITWAEYGSYPQQGDDYCHPGVGIDLEDPTIGYIGCVFGQKLTINIWDGSRLLFNPYSLKVLDYNATYEGRLGTQFAPALTGGTFVFWSSDNIIKMCYLSQKGVSTTPTAITAGRSPGVATDRFGNIHLVYYNGGIKYRKLNLTTLQALAPKNRVSDTRTPRFRWTRTSAAVYTVEITRDGNKLPAFTCSSNAWRPASDLRVGSYSWRIKEGRPDSTARWSKSLDFQIPPSVPKPVTPHTRYPAAPVKPVFEWAETDPDATHYTVELFGAGDSLGSLSTAGKTLTVKWGAALPAGHYAWRVKAVRTADGQSVASAWSEDMAFQIAVPGACSFTNPDSFSVFEPGWQSITCSWTEAEGAETYSLKMILNGELFEKVEDHGNPRVAIAKAYQPGYYSLFVKSVNDYGTGPWSRVRTFIVRRQMTPEDRTLSDSPRILEWTRSKGATKYLVKLHWYDKSLQKYKLVMEKWIGQPNSGAPFWRLPFKLGSGAFRWTTTDYTHKKQGYSSVAYFQVRSPGAPALLSPDGAAAGHRLLAFEWSDPSAFAEQFQLQIWKGKTKVQDTDWLDAAPLEKGSFQKTISFADDAGGAYTWRVRGRNDYGASPWKEGALQLTPLATPDLMEPAGTTLTAGTQRLFSWNPVDSATHYEIAIIKGGSTVETATTTETDWLWTPAAGTYTFQLRAGETGWSRWFSRTFTVSD